MAGSLNREAIRFLRLVKDFSDDAACWSWIGAGKGNGYGHSRYKRKNMGAHRKAFLLFVGEIPEGFDVCHRCDNRWCVNPAHLFLGTRTENMADAMAKNRTSGGNRKHLKEDKIQEVIRMHNRGAAPSEIGRALDINHHTVSKITKGESYVGKSQ